MVNEIKRINKINFINNATNTTLSYLQIVPPYPTVWDIVAHVISLLFSLMANDIHEFHINLFHEKI